MEIAALIAGILGAAGAVFSLLFARRANRIADDALQEAKKANTISGEANTIAREGNTIAVAANKLAEHANEVAQEGHARQTERNDVVWELNWIGYGLLEMSNVGQDPAHEVFVVVTIGDHEVKGSSELVGDPIRLDFEIVAREREREVGRNAADRAARIAEAPYLSMLPSLIPQTIDPGLYAYFHATWRTELGQPRTEDGRQIFESDDPLG